MKPDNLLNVVIGTGGTFLASITPEKAAAIFAGFATGTWMLYQLGASVYDRFKR